MENNEELAKQARKEYEKAKNMTDEELENSSKHKALKSFGDFFNAVWDSTHKN